MDGPTQSALMLEESRVNDEDRSTATGTGQQSIHTEWASSTSEAGQTTPAGWTWKRWIPILILIAIVITSTTVGIVLGTRGGGSKSDSTPAVAAPPEPAPTSLPPTIQTPVPTLSSQPSQSYSPSASISPTGTSWTTQARIEGPSFGTSVHLSTEDLLVFFNSSHIFTYELLSSTDEWEQVEHVLVGNMVRLSETKRILVLEGLIIKAYDLVDGTWAPVGQEITGVRMDVEAIAISGDGLTIAVSGPHSNNLQHFSEIYQYDDNSDAWLEHGRRVATESGLGQAAIEPLSEIALSFDGNLFAVGLDEAKYGGVTLIYQAPAVNANSQDWTDALLRDRVFAFGQGVALSRNATLVVTAGLGRVVVFDGTTGDAFFQIQPGIPSHVRIVLALTGDGNLLAFAWQNNLRVVKILDDSYVTMNLEQTDFEFNIESLSFGSNDKLAVGQPGANFVEILLQPI